jgi:hypothetical protein
LAICGEDCRCNCSDEYTYELVDGPYAGPVSFSEPLELTRLAVDCTDGDADCAFLTDCYEWNGEAFVWVGTKDKDEAGAWLLELFTEEPV